MTEPRPEAAFPSLDLSSTSIVSRRTLLRTGALTGGGLIAAAIAACAPAAAVPAFTYAPPAPPQGSGSAAAPSASASAAASDDHAGHSGTPASAAPAGSSAPADHDAAAAAVVKRFLDGEGASLDGAGNGPIEPKIVDGVKVFELTVDKIKHKIDALKDPVDALGFNGTWPGPRIEVVEGDRIRAIFKNNLDESTGIHFHGQRIPNNMDGVPHVTQDPILPGDSFTYEFVARTPGSHMYHSHHNATDQVGRGLLGAFIVQPKNPADRYVQRDHITQDIVWISNDSIGGFTINGRGFPATLPIVATVGDKIAVRFMNEGVMMHPWHLHGMPMRVVARDGYPLPQSFLCDTLGVNPGERWDVIIDCEDPGAWAFHCHILPHAEGRDGMFGMVTALVIQPPASSASSDLTRYATAASPTAPGPIRSAAAAAGSTAFECRISTTG